MSQARATFIRTITRVEYMVDDAITREHAISLAAAEATADGFGDMTITDAHITDWLTWRVTMQQTEQFEIEGTT